MVTIKTRRVSDLHTYKHTYGYKYSVKQTVKINYTRTDTVTHTLWIHTYICKLRNKAMFSVPSTTHPNDSDKQAIFYLELQTKEQLLFSLMKF